MDYNKFEGFSGIPRNFTDFLKILNYGYSKRDFQHISRNSRDLKRFKRFQPF